MDRQEAIDYSIKILKDKKVELEEYYKNSVEVKQRIEKEPEEFIWKWEDGGYWVIIYNEYPAEIKELELGILVLCDRGYEQGYKDGRKDGQNTNVK
jgi:hypothetical protein